MTTVPVTLESERLVLRQLEDNDWHDLHEHYSNLNCTRYTFGRALTEGETWRAVASMLGHWVLRGYGPYALEEKSTGKVIGVSGLWYPNDWPEPEIKWALSEHYWGKGYASEAVRTIKTMLLKHWSSTPPISFINAHNQASIQLALAVGATFERETEFRSSLWHVYRHHFN